MSKDWQQAETSRAHFGTHIDHEILCCWELIENWQICLVGLIVWGKCSAYFFYSEFFFQEEILFKRICYTEAKEEKVQRDRLEGESKSEKNWISIEIGKKKE